MKYIALDIGNVLCTTNMTKFINKVSSTFNISEAEVFRWMRGFQILHDIGITIMENQLRDHFGVKSKTTIDDIIGCWNDCIYPHVTPIDAISKMMKQHDVKVALLSNIGVEHAILMEEKLAPIYQDSIKHFSCYVGARKPTSLYYQSFLMEYPEFKGCLYVDDLQENLEVSKRFGFQTFRLALDEPNCYDKIREIVGLMTENS